MSPTSWLSTADAEEQYGFPAKTFAAWCREGKIASARKVDGEWLMPAEGVAAFLQANPQFKPPERNVAVQVPGWLWQALGVVALVVGFIADVYAVRDIIRGGDRTVLWIVVAGLSAGLWIAAIIILTAKRRRGIFGWNGNQPVYQETRRYSSRLVRLAAWAAFISVPALVILGIVGYHVWRADPAVADRGAGRGLPHPGRRGSQRRHREAGPGHGGNPGRPSEHQSQAPQPAHHRGGGQRPGTRHRQPARA